MRTFEGLSPIEARLFAERWLPAWTGNEPQRLIEFYSEDAFYSDPALPGGVTGHAAILAYFTKLLKRNPSWVWSQQRSTPMENGFVNYWRATIPVGDTDRTVDIDGVCLVYLSQGLISRNEVYFDRVPLLPPK